MFSLSKTPLYFPVASVPRRTAPSSPSSAARVSTLPSPRHQEPPVPARPLRLLAEPAVRRGGWFWVPVQVLCSWPRPGCFPRGGFCWGTPLQRTGWRLQSLMRLLLGVTSGLFVFFSNLLPVSRYLDSHRFVFKTIYSLHRLGSCVREHTQSYI